MEKWLRIRIGGLAVAWLVVTYLYGLITGAVVAFFIADLAS